VSGSECFSPWLAGAGLTLAVILSPADAGADGLALVIVADGDDRDVPQGGVSLSAGARYFLALV
ncbi:TPA: hypothetical protein N2G33_004738, partial [Salmonella enterica]|nr:hypothetical protein [Salmonella enterica]